MPSLIGSPRSLGRPSAHYASRRRPRSPAASEEEAADAIALTGESWLKKRWYLTRESVSAIIRWSPSSVAGSRLDFGKRQTSR